jgi:hypothetical protein
VPFIAAQLTGAAAALAVSRLLFPPRGSAG